MPSNLINFCTRLQFLRGEEGQDLIEYALVVALVALAAAVGVRVLAGDVGSAFTTIGANLSNYLT